MREIHEFIAAISHTPEFALSDDESKRLAGALVNVSKHYKVPVINPKYVALATLAGVSFSIYKPRIVALASKGKPRTPLDASSAPKSSNIPPKAELASQTAPRVDDWFAAPGGNA